MTLKLVSVEGQMIPDISLADELTNFVDNLDEQAVGAITALVLADGSIKIVWFGEDYSPYELMGLFEAAKLRVFADDCCDE